MLYALSEGLFIIYYLNEHFIGSVEMAENPKVEVLGHIITNIQHMLVKSREVGLDSVVYRLEAAAMEAEHLLTGVLPALNSKPAK